MKKCINKRCSRELPDDFLYCPHCGKSQSDTAKKAVKRPNGTGSIYFRKDNKTNPWAAASSVSGKQVYLGSFTTRTEAVRALQEYEYCPSVSINITFDKLHEKWQSTTYKSLGKSAQENYNAAYIKLSPLYSRKFRDIRTGDMQAIIDYYDAPHHEQGVGGKLKYLDDKGRGTYNVTNTPKICEGLKFSALHKVKCLLTSMYAYAMKNDIVNKNYAAFVELPPKNETSKSRFTDVQLEKVRQIVGIVPYADYILAMCYLNFRVSEFLELTIDNYHESNSGIPCFIGGKKTDAGTNRLVPIHPKIRQIVIDNLEKGGETVFCGVDGKALTPDYFRKYCFYPAIASMDLPNDLTPHSCRRTFSTRMSAAGARQEDIIALMGHTNFAVDIDHYINQEVGTLYNAITKMA
ncbi:MAG: site-specific integrase [Clostridia bacterium]|nr:site-specific integrase [Clostridia bacterium]